MGLFNFAQEAIQPISSEITTTSVVVEESNSWSALVGPIIFAVLLVVIVSIIALWRIFSKANEAGWKAIIPIYNTITLLKIIGRPWWWILLFLVPVLQFVIFIIVMLDLGKSFGKSTVFSVFGLIIFEPIGILILAFGGDKYVGPGGQAAAPAQPAA